MRYFIFLLLIIGFSSCLNNQWEDHVARGDTGSVTHGDHKKENGIAPCGNNIKHNIDSEGSTLFNAKCSSCHNASSRASTGPGLMNVLNRIPGGDWKYHFIRNADSVIKSGDGYAVAKFEEYNRIQHTRFPNLKNEEIDAILEYCNASPCH